MRTLARSALSFTYVPFRACRSIGRRAGLAGPASLRVITYHDIHPASMGSLADQLQWLADRWEIITPWRMERIIAGDGRVSGDMLLISFDDGFASGLRAAEEVLEPLGISAIFFVVTGLADMEDREEAREFIASKTYPGRSPDDLPGHVGNLCWRELDGLLERGHAVGAHTVSHARLSNELSDDELRNEIVSSGDIIERRLGIKVEHFAFPFGDLESISPRSLDLAAQRYGYSYTGIRGENIKKGKPNLLWRDAVDPEERKSMTGAWLEGTADPLYARARRVLTSGRS